MLISTTRIRPPVKANGGAVLLRDRVGAVPADGQALAAEREVAGLGLPLALGDGEVVDVQRGRADGLAVLAVALLRELHRRARGCPTSSSSGETSCCSGGMPRKLLTYQSLRSLRKSVWPPNRAPLAMSTPSRVGVGDLDLGQDLERPAPDLRRRELRHRRGVGVVAVDAALRDLGHRHLLDQVRERPVVERQHVVLAGLDVPEVDQLLDLVGVLGREVVRPRSGPPRSGRAPRCR